MRAKISSMLLYAMLMLILSPACSRRPKVIPEPEPASAPDSVAGIVVADTIIYEVIITSPDPDDAWKTKCLGRLQRRVLIDSIFSLVYQNRAVAFNHETNEKLTRKQVEKIESVKGFSRDDIGMIQFTEAWYLNPGKITMTKKVLSLVLGYNFYLSESGELFGHKPVFRVEMGEKSGEVRRER